MLPAGWRPATRRWVRLLAWERIQWFVMNPRMYGTAQRRSRSPSARSPTWASWGLGTFMPHACRIEKDQAARVDQIARGVSDLRALGTSAWARMAITPTCAAPSTTTDQPLGILVLLGRRARRPNRR